MRVVFFGTPSIAAELLEMLLSSRSPAFEIVGVVSRPDRPQGRHRQLVATPVKQVALAHDLPILQPQRSSTPEALQWLNALQPDLFLVIAYGEIVRQSVLDIPRWGAYNLHASLLPAYRGAAPIERALLNGETRTGWSLQRMVLDCDAGDILSMQSLEVGPETTSGELRAQLTALAQPILLAGLQELADRSGCVALQPQDENLVSWAPKIANDELRIAWSQPVATIHNHIRALSPKPAAWSVLQLDDKQIRVKLMRSRLLGQHILLKPGYVRWQAGQCLVGGANGALELLEVQPEGKRIMSGRDFCNGLGACLSGGEVHFE